MLSFAWVRPAALLGRRKATYVTGLPQTANTYFSVRRSGCGFRGTRAITFAVAKASSRNVEPTYLRGHRCKLVGPLKKLAPGSSPKPPLILIGGTGQWLDSWTGHVSALARDRAVFVYDARGQGAATSSLDVSDCRLSQHVADFHALVAAAELQQPVDVVGFSFGGRVAMAAAVRAATMPDESVQIRRVCITGVAADIGASGRLARQGWKAALQAKDLQSFGWQLLLSTNSQAFLARNEAHVPTWVAAISRANSVAGVRAIVEMTHTDDPEDPDHPLRMGELISTTKANSPERGLVICGKDDLLSPAAEGQNLASAIGWDFCAIDDAGHAVPIEQAVPWRRTVLKFLDD